MYKRLEDVQNVFEFFEQLQDYMGNGDTLRQTYEEVNGEYTDVYRLYNSCGCLLAEYNEVSGAKSY